MNVVAILKRLVTCVLGDQPHESIEIGNQRLLVVYGSAAGSQFAIIPGWYRGNEKYEKEKLVAVDVELVDLSEQPELHDRLAPTLSNRFFGNSSQVRISFWGSFGFIEQHEETQKNEESQHDGGIMTLRAVKEQGEAEKAARRSGALVLVVDDDPSIREIVKMALQKEGFQVETASNVVETKQKLASSSVLPNLILLDIMMPGDSGWKLLKDMEQDSRLNKIPVIAISGLERPPQEYDSTMLYDYLVKPFSMAELSRAVKKFSQK